MFRVSVKSLGSLVTVAVAGVAYNYVHKSKQQRIIGFSRSICDPIIPSLKNELQHCHIVEEVIMADGSRYVGTLHDGKRWGEGESWEKRGHYKGTWVDNVKCGSGVFTYVNGSIYEGSFANDLPNGHGKMILLDGKVFEGEFVNGALQGQPRILLRDTHRYEGDVINDLPHGLGRIVFDNGSVVESEFYQGIPARECKYTDEEGNVHEGEFMNTRLNGLGKVTKKDGSVFQGTFVGGRLYGQGRVRHADGTTLTGDFKNGRAHGPVTMKRPNGTVLEGTALYGKFHGRMVREVRVDGTIIVRDYVNGVPQSKVKMTTSDKVIREGNMVRDPSGKNESMHGLVRITLPNKTVSVSEYIHGVANGPCKITFPCGKIQEGVYKCGKQYGEWKETQPDGTIVFTDYTPNVLEKVKVLEREQRLIHLPKLKHEVKAKINGLQQKWRET